MAMTGRWLTLNLVVRVNQIEATRELDLGEDERRWHTPEEVARLRDAVGHGWPGGSVTWALTWKALIDPSPAYVAIRALLARYQRDLGDDVTFLPGAYFANAHEDRDAVDGDLAAGLTRVRELVGGGYVPRSVVAGFLSAANQRTLAEVHGIHVCQGNVFSQYAIDAQDGDGSPCYPYYPSREHFCKPAQSERDRVDCVTLDGWTVDFLAARRAGFADGFNSRMGVGPIETVGAFGEEIGLTQMLASTETHFHDGFARNGFAWVTSGIEVSVAQQTRCHNALTRWLARTRERWPDARLATIGEFGLRWRAEHRDNAALDYRFVQRGTGIGGSDAPLEIRWFMNRSFRLSLLRDWRADTPERVIDLTRYDLPAEEPATPTRSWSLLGRINQKGTRPQDRPVPLAELPQDERALVLGRYPELARH